MRATAPVVLGLAAGATLACTTLGPLPATTAMPALPAERAEVSAQLGVVPGTYLSEGTTEEHEGGGFGQAAFAWDPGPRFALPGLVLAARLGGPEHDVFLEPVLGWRTQVGAGDRVALGVFAFGTHSSATDDQASYGATRAGLEGAVDVRVTPTHRWFEAHVLGSLALSAVDAHGRYCLDDAGVYGVDCPDTGAVTVSIEASGVYPSGSLGLALYTGRHRPGVWHGARLAGHIGAGLLPTYVGGIPDGAGAYVSAGVLFSLALGAR